MIRIVKLDESDGFYEVGDILEVIEADEGDGIVVCENQVYVYHSEYEIHRKAGEEDAPLYTCDYCGTNLGELACSSQLEGAFCSTACACAYVVKHDIPSDQDAVNSPNHYTQGRFETIEVIEEITQGYSDGYVAYCVGNALKYLSRAPFKHGEPTEDIGKAAKYLEFALGRLQTQK